MKYWLALNTRISINEETVSIIITPPDKEQTVSISIQAKLFSKGRDLKLTIAADEGLVKRDPPIPSY